MSIPYRAEESESHEGMQCYQEKDFVAGVSVGILCGTFGQTGKDRMYLPFPDSWVSFRKKDNRNADREHSNADHGTKQESDK